MGRGKQRKIGNSRDPCEASREEEEKRDSQQQHQQHQQQQQ